MAAPAIMVDSDRSIEEISSTCDSAQSCEASSNSDVISVNTTEQIPLATPLRPSTVISLCSGSLTSVEEIVHTVPSSTREKLAYEVIYKKRNIEEICICCGSCEIHAQHPLFHGGICAPCTEKFVERFFLCDDDGYQANCAICCGGELLVMCDNPDCIRSFCTKCLDLLVGQGTAEKVKKISPWVCFLCLSFHDHGVLKKKRNWREKLKFFYDREFVREHLVALLQMQGFLIFELTE